MAVPQRPKSARRGEVQEEVTIYRASTKKWIGDTKITARCLSASLETQ